MIRLEYFFVVAFGCLLLGCQTDQPTISTHDDLKPTVTDGWQDLSPTPIPSNEEAANRAARAQLKTIVSLHKDCLTMDQAIRFLRDTTGANVAVNWPALELVGIDQDALLSCQLSRVPAHVYLKFVLDQISADAFDDERACFRIREGIVKISTQHDLKRNKETRVYDIRQLLVKLKLQAALYRNHQRASELIELLKQDDWWNSSKAPSFGGAPNFDLNEALSSTSSGGGGRGRGRLGDGDLFGDNEPDKRATELATSSGQEKIEILIEIIQTTVGDPDEWLDEDSTLNELNGNFIIKTTPENHVQIEALLGRLAGSLAEHFKARALAIEVFLLLEDAEAYRLKQAYPEALKKINQALRVDPTNPEAKALKDIVRSTLSR